MVQAGVGTKAIALEPGGELLGGIGHRPGGVAVPVGHRCLVGVLYAAQIGVVGHAGAPHIIGALAGSAVAGRVIGVGQGAVVPQHLPGGLGGGPVAGVAGAIVGPVAAHAPVDLAGIAVAHVKTQAPVVVQPPQHIGPGADGLGLQGLQGPGVAHLITDDPPDIVL